MTKLVRVTTNTNGKQHELKVRAAVAICAVTYPICLRMTDLVRMEFKIGSPLLYSGHGRCLLGLPGQQETLR